MGLQRHSLYGTIQPTISIDEFNPKTGEVNEVIVVAFYFIDEAPAKDFSSFIDSGFIRVIDSEVSPNPDENGNYVVFVEVTRNAGFYRKFYSLLRDIENITDKTDWRVRPYLSFGRTYSVNEPEWESKVIINSEEYHSRKQELLGRK